MLSKENKPWWFPRVCDEAYCNELRKDTGDYHLTDEELIDEYNEGAKYSKTWDHTGDAYEQFEPLADDYLKLRDAAWKAAR